MPEFSRKMRQTLFLTVRFITPSRAKSFLPGVMNLGSKLLWVFYNLCGLSAIQQAGPEARGVMNMLIVDPRTGDGGNALIKCSIEDAITCELISQQEVAAARQAKQDQIEEG